MLLALLALSFRVAAFAPGAVDQRACAAVSIPVPTRVAVAPTTRVAAAAATWFAAKTPLDLLAAGFKSLFAAPVSAPFNSSGLDPPGFVVRCAAKAANASRAKGWDTNKPSVPGFSVGFGGAGGDFNHYRTTALKGTPDRALSIMTAEVVAALVLEGWPVRDGDLGENLLVSGFPYDAFRVGQRYLLGQVLVQITEPIVPCGYLCRLPWLAERWRCDDFITTLRGRRGWYARVLTEGFIHVGDPVLTLEAAI